jgi:hypothetical protein
MRKLHTLLILAVALAAHDAGAQTNLAAGRNAAQSSTYTGFPASLAVDGNTDGNASDGSVTITGSGSENNPWWQVDLGSSVALSSIVIWNRTDCCGARLSDYWIFASDTPFQTSDTPAALQARAGTWSNHQTVSPNPSATINTTGGQGRYVRIQLSGANYLSLAEVQIYGPNLAAGRAATQSSTYSGYPASLAVDGNTDGNATHGSVTVTASGSELSPWWQVDLGASVFVNAAGIWNRTDCCGSRLSDYWVFISDTPFQATDAPGTLQNRAGTWNSHQTLTPNPSSLIAAGGAQGRYLRVQLTGTNYLSVAEVQVFGSSASGATPHISAPLSLPNATVGVAYAPTQFTVTGGTPPYSWSASGLPSGLTMNTAGILSGTPLTAAGSPFSVSVAVTDSLFASAVANYSLTVASAAGGTNLARNKTAAQSSTYPNFPASLAVDGNTDGNGGNGSVTVTNSGSEMNPWWQVDLGASYTLSSIAIWNRTDCCGSRLSDYWVFVSDNPFQPGDTPATLQNRAATWNSHQTAAPNPFTVVAATGVQGRYVRVQLGGANYLSLAEVQVFGAGDGPVPALSVVSSHTGHFLQNGVYSVTVTNRGAAPTFGTLNVTDDTTSPAFPAGLIIGAVSGTGWTCTPAASSAACSTNAPITGGSSPGPVLVNVSVPAGMLSNSPGVTLTNSVTASGGGASGAATNSDPTLIGDNPPDAGQMVAISEGGVTKYQFTYTDLDGYADLDHMQVMFNSLRSSQNSCWVIADTAGNLYLADSGGALTGPITAGGPGAPLSNSQCSVNPGGSSVTVLGNTATVKLAVTFTSLYAAPQIVYSEVDDAAGIDTGWKPAGAIQAPVISSISGTAGVSGSVTINGSNFGASQNEATVNIGGVGATITSWSSTQIIATVPAVSGNVYAIVTVGGVPSAPYALSLGFHPNHLARTSDGFLGRRRDLCDHSESDERLQSANQSDLPQQSIDPCDGGQFQQLSTDGTRLEQYVNDSWPNGGERLISGLGRG